MPSLGHALVNTSEPFHEKGLLIASLGPPPGGLEMVSLWNFETSDTASSGRCDFTSSLAILIIGLGECSSRPFSKGAAALELPLALNSDLSWMEGKLTVCSALVCDAAKPQDSFLGWNDWPNGTLMAPGQQKKEIPRTPQVSVCQDTQYSAPHL